MFDYVIQIIPPDEVRVVSWLGSIPRKDGGFPHFTSAIASPGPHIFLPGSEVVGRISNETFSINLFKHDTSTDGDYAELELGKLILNAKVKVQARIGDSSRVDRAAFWKAYFNSQERDPLKHAEDVLNAPVREILSKQKFSFQPDDNVENIQITTISTTEFLTALGLIRSGPYLVKDTSLSPERQKVADNILTLLDFIGMKLINISIEDIAFADPEVKNALNSIIVAEAKQAAELATAKGQAKVIEQEIENKKKLAEGLAKALQILADAEAGGEPVGIDRAFMTQVGLPSMKEVVGKNDKFFISNVQDLLTMLNPGKT